MEIAITIWQNEARLALNRTLTLMYEGDEKFDCFYEATHKANSRLFSRQSLERLIEEKELQVYFYTPYKHKKEIKDEFFNNVLGTMVNLSRWLYSLIPGYSSKVMALSPTEFLHNHIMKRNIEFIDPKKATASQVLKLSLPAIPE